MSIFSMKGNGFHKKLYETETEQFRTPQAWEKLIDQYKRGSDSAYNTLIMGIRDENENLIRSLLQRIKEDDNDSIGLLLDAKRQFVANICWKYFQNSAQVEDLTQETFIKAIRALQRDKYEFRESFRQWLFRVASNVCRTELDKLGAQKRSGSETVYIQDMKADPDDDTPVDLPGDTPTPEETMIFGERKTYMKKLVNKLPPDMRDTIDLLFYQGCSYEQAAAILKVEIGTIRSRRNRAIQKLGEIVRNMDEEDREALFAENMKFKERGKSR